MNGFQKKGGFTLIEILVVVVIVAILMGGTFRLMGVASENSKRAQTVSRLEKIQNALGAYYAEYGQYPPSVTVVPGSAERKYVAMTTGYRMPPPAGISGGAQTDPPGDMVFGLPSYLIPRLRSMYGNGIRFPEADKIYANSVGGAIPGWGTGYTWKQLYDMEAVDPRTDVCNRWLPQLKGLVDLTKAPELYVDEEGKAVPYLYRSFGDAWDREFIYECLPPFQTYRLWSVGPDGLTYFQRSDETVARVYTVIRGGSSSLGKSTVEGLVEATRKKNYSEDSVCNRDDIEMSNR